MSESGVDHGIPQTCMFDGNMKIIHWGCSVFSQIDGWYILPFVISSLEKRHPKLPSPRKKTRLPQNSKLSGRSWKNMFPYFLQYLIAIGRIRLIWACPWLESSSVRHIVIQLNLLSIEMYGLSICFKYISANMIYIILCLSIALL